DRSASGESVYNYYRDYSPDIGRYIESDPVGLKGGTNTYGYSAQNPLSFYDPFGLCKVEVRFTKIGPNWYHAYILTTSPDGSQKYFRGGPSAAGPSGGASSVLGSASGGSASGSSGSRSSGASNSSNSSSPGSGLGGPRANNGPWGPINTNSGPYLPGTVDYETGAPPSVVMQDDNEPCGCNSAFASTLNNIQNAQIPYNPLSTNSNATARALLQGAGFSPTTPPVWAPGWSTPLPQ
ncbi:MAG: RHS repeat-associated core domain-containing protein, partial [Betaproteobacteria bacterium]